MYSGKLQNLKKIKNEWLISFPFNTNQVVPSNKVVPFIVECTYQNALHMSKKICNFKKQLSVKYELSLQGKKWNCLMYTLFKSGKFSSFTFKVYQYRRILPENESNITPQNVNRGETI